MMKNQEIFKEELKQAVVESLSEIYIKPDRRKLRCHEIAKLLLTTFQKRGYKNNVKKDGIVRYSRKFLDEIIMKDFFEGDEGFRGAFVEELRREQYKNLFTSPIVHSWCEVDGFIVDYHTLLKVSSKEYYEHFLLVEKEEELSDKVVYTPIGREFSLLGKPYLYIPLYYITRIRVE